MSPDPRWPGTTREQLERARHHEGREPSERPIVTIDEPTPSFKPGLSGAFAHMSSAMGASSKRIAIVVGLWGTVSTPFAAGLAWWATHQGFITQEQQSQKDREQREIYLSVKVIEATVGAVGPRMDKIEDKVNAHSEALASLRPTVEVKARR